MQNLKLRLKTFKFLPLFLIFNFLLFTFPKSVSAHAFGTIYNLPVPFWLYLYGAGAALIISFLVIGFFLNQTRASLTYPEQILPNPPGWLGDLVRVFSLIFFITAVVSGLAGTNDSLLNFNMTFFWIVMLLGVTYLCAFLGDIYLSINPWKTLTIWWEVIFGKITGLVKYPKKFSYWSAFIFYFILIWLELFGAMTPFKLSIVLIQFSLVTLLGIIAFGSQDWFEYCDFLGVFFRLIGKVAPFKTDGSKLYLRPPMVGLLDNSAKDFSLLVFVLFMLSSTAYDGFHSTATWINFALLFGDSNFQTVQEVGLMAAPVVFLVVYLIFISLMKMLVKTKFTIKELALKFGFTLVPIALVYNVAHYYTLLLTQGQQIVKLVSDPLGVGWNLFGTANIKLGSGIIDAGFVWHSQVFFILAGHIAAVYLSHLVSLEVFKDHKQAVISQLPMLFLMVVYTGTGLWILSQPIKGL